MDPVTLVVTALAAGALAGVSTMASSLVVDAYQELKTLVLGRFRIGAFAEDDGARLISRAADRESGQPELSRALAEVGVDQATADAAQRLLDLLEQKGKFVVDASQAKGIIIGDNAEQHNTFN